MALLPPRVIGPLSECSGSVRVQGQLTGSTVTILPTARSWRPARHPGLIRPSRSRRSLGAGQEVTATQTVGLDTSPPSPEAVEVQAKPPVVGGGVSQPPESVRRMRVARGPGPGRQGRVARRRHRARERRELRRQRALPPVHAAVAGHGRSRPSRRRAASRAGDRRSASGRGGREARRRCPRRSCRRRCANASVASRSATSSTARTVTLMRSAGPEPAGVLRPRLALDGRQPAPGRWARRSARARSCAAAAS